MLLARTLASELDRELSTFSGILKALATSPAIEDNDLRRFHQQASRVVPEGAAIVMRDRSGQQLINTLFPFETRLPVTTALAVLAADQCVFRTEAICASDLYIGTTDQQPYVLLNAPVHRNGRVEFALNIAFRAQHLASLLSGERIPQGWGVSIIDRQDRIVARSSEHDRFVGTLANEGLRREAQGSEGSFRSVNILGTPVWGAYVRLPSWDWRIAIGLPESVLRAPLRQSLIYLGAAGALAVGLSIIAALLYGRRLGRSIAVLSDMAARVGASSIVPAITTSIREVDEVGASLARASAKLQASVAERDRVQAELRVLNEGLEARVEAEVAAREEAQAKAAHAQRMQALGQLAGGIAHDFNNVLQATTGCAATIEKRATDPDAVRRFARLILTASERGVSVTRRLLTFSQQNDLRAETVHLPTLLGSLQEILRHTLGRHISIHIALPEGLPALTADKGQLETVLVNLATNARDAMESGGSLTFSASAEDTAMGRPGRYVRIAVTDTGTGMDSATRARAMDPFFTTKGRGEGNGLGLAMARGFAEQSGGALSIKSEPGAGTSVFLWLPVEQRAMPVVKPMDSAPEAKPRAPRLRILLVEDEDLVRQVVAMQLEDEGHEVLQASNAEEALQMLEQSKTTDALVTDFNMPRMNGVELIRALRARGMSIPAILLTGNAEDGAPLAVESTTQQDFALLRKPVLGSVLASRLISLTVGG